MKRALPLVLVLVGCPGTFDVDQYVVADGDSEGTGSSDGETESGESGSDSESDSESESDSDTSTDATDTEGTDTDVDCGPDELDIGTTCIVHALTLDLDDKAPTDIATDIALADFTGDGLIDLLIAGPEVSLWFGDGAGGLGATTVSVTAASGTALAIGALDDDNLVDFAAISPNQINLFIQVGAGVFTSDAMLAAGGHDGVFGDIDGDEDLDLVVSGDSLRVYIQDNGNWLLGSEKTHAGLGLTIGELNGDANLDVGLAITANSQAGLFSNDGAGGMLDPLLGLVDSASDVAAIDLNAHAQRELVATSSVDGTLEMFMFAGEAIVETDLRTVGDGPVAIAVGDIDGDGIDDLAVANSASHDVSILLGNGSSVSTEFRTLDPDPADAPESIEIADLDDDGRGEIVVGMLGSNRVVVYGHAPSRP